MDASALINIVVVAALILLAVSVALLVNSIMPLLRQGESTLAALERLSNTLDREVPATFGDLREVIGGVNNIKALTTRRVNEVGIKAEEAAQIVNQLVDVAKKGSSVVSSGILAGLKAYFLGKDNNSSR